MNMTVSLTKTLRDGRTATVIRRDRAWTVLIDDAPHAAGAQVVAMKPIGDATHAIADGGGAPIGITTQEAKALRGAAAYLDPARPSTSRVSSKCKECHGTLYPYGAHTGMGPEHGYCYDCQ